MIKLLSLLLTTELILPYANAVKPKPRQSSFASQVVCYERQIEKQTNVESKISEILSNTLTQPFTVEKSNDSILITITDEEFESPTEKEIYDTTVRLKDECESLCNTITKYFSFQQIGNYDVEIRYISKDGTEFFSVKS